MVVACLLKSGCVQAPPTPPPALVFQILPSLRASGAMLDVVDSCSMLYRLQMEGGQTSAVPLAPVPCPLPQSEGKVPWPGPRAGQELMRETLPVPLQDLGRCASHGPGYWLCSCLPAGGRPGAPAAPALSPSSHRVPVSMPMLAPAVPTACPPGLRGTGGTYSPVSACCLLLRTREGRVSQSPGISERFLNIVTPCDLVGSLDGGGHSSGGYGGLPSSCWGAGCFSSLPWAQQSQTCTYSRIQVSKGLSVNLRPGQGELFPGDSRSLPSRGDM